MLVLKDELGHQFVVVKSGNGEISVPVQTAVPVSSLPKADFVVVKEDELAPFHVYSFSEIRQMGGIDALSEAIGNNHSIKAPLIEFSEKEWEEIVNDLSDDK